MNLPLTLRRRFEAAPALAWLAEDSDPQTALRVCAQFGLNPSNRIFAVADALLVRLDEPSQSAFPLGTRLRPLDSTGNLLLPVDADLTPALLDDEIAILGRRQGLIFLHGGRVLAFDPSSPLPLSALLTATPKPPRLWSPLPSRAPLAETIHEWILDLPGDSAPFDVSDFSSRSADEVLEPGGEGIAAQSTPLEHPGAYRHLAVRARELAGRAMRGLGRSLGLSGMQKLGQSWLRHAPLESLPAPGASIESRQAAALRALLREFREGDPERALRHALPFRESGDSRVRPPEANSHLPDQTITYSLSSLLGPSERGHVTQWTGGQDVLADLIQEYRRAAQKARDRGDYRRAAFIYGRLLRDYATAAQTLIAGGLYRDAAILYLVKLNSPMAAARAFEAACDFDRALSLYRRESNHESAGDLLRKLGRNDEALVEYRKAASALLARHQTSVATGQIAAGRLMSVKAGRPDLALEHFLAGWRRREHPSSLLCAVSAASLLADATRAEDLLTLAAEADDWLTSEAESPTRAALWYNHLAALSDLPEMESAASTLRDRARMGLARNLSREVQPGVKHASVLASLFTPRGRWSATLLRDAEFAARARLAKFETRTSSRPSPPLDLDTGAGQVLSFAAAPAADLLFLGFQSGHVLCVRTTSMEIISVAQASLPVVSIATDADGRSLAVLRQGRGGQGELSTFARQGESRFQAILETPIDGLFNPWLTSISTGDPIQRIGIWDGVSIHIDSLAGSDLSRAIEPPSSEDRPAAALLLDAVPSNAEASFTRLLVNQGHDWFLIDPGSNPSSARLTWRPAEQGPGSLRHIVLSFSRLSPQELELVMITEHGALGWAAIRIERGIPRVTGSVSRACRSVDVYRAACLVCPGQVAAVSRLSVDLLRRSSSGLALHTSLPSDLPDVVAVTADSTASNLCLITGEGRLRRLPISG